MGTGVGTLCALSGMVVQWGGKSLCTAHYTSQCISMHDSDSKPAEWPNHHCITQLKYAPYTDFCHPIVYDHPV